MTYRALLAGVLAAFAGAWVFACAQSGSTGSTPDAGAGTDGATGQDGATGLDGPAPPVGGFTLNEISGKGEEWAELFNAGVSAVDISGYKVSEANKDGGAPKTGGFAFPPNTTIPAGGYIVVMGASEGGIPCVAPAGIPCYQASFLVSNSSGETIYLLAPDDKIVDRGDYPANTIASGHGWGRFPNGTGPFQIVNKTPGAANKL